MTRTEGYEDMSWKISTGVRAGGKWEMTSLDGFQRLAIPDTHFSIGHGYFLTDETNQPKLTKSKYL